MSGVIPRELYHRRTLVHAPNERHGSLGIPYALYERNRVNYERMGSLMCASFIFGTRTFVLNIVRDLRAEAGKGRGGIGLPVDPPTSKLLQCAQQVC